MRNLAIERRKASPNGGKPMEVYISDPMGQKEVHGNLCRLLGILENGQIAIFPVETSASTIYVIQPGMDSGAPCEYCCLPDGEADVFLTGRCRFIPFAGHPFHFDGNDSSVVVKQQRKNLLTVLIICVLAVALGITAGKLLPKLLTAQRDSTPQTFRESGMQITLTQDFRQVDVTDQGFTTGYASGDTSVFVLRESFEDSLGSLSVQEYAQLVLSSNPQESGGTPVQEGNLTIYEYTAISSVDGQQYAYFVTFFKGPDAFWMIEFTTLEDNAAAMRQTYINYANSVHFPDAAI